MFSVSQVETIQPFRPTPVKMTFHTDLYALHHDTLCRTLPNYGRVTVLALLGLAKKLALLEVWFQDHVAA